MPLLALVGCNKSDKNGLEVPNIIIDKSLDIFEGLVQSQEVDRENSEDLWKVRIRSVSGAIVEFYWYQTDDSLYRIDGLSGPYDDNYDIFPGNGLYNFKSAKFAATSQLKNNDLLDWRLRIEDSFNDLWIYSLTYNENGGKITAYVNAKNGEVLEID